MSIPEWEWCVWKIGWSRLPKGEEMTAAIWRVSAMRTGEIDGIEAKIWLSHSIRLITLRKYSTDGALRSNESTRRSKLPIFSPVNWALLTIGVISRRRPQQLSTPIRKIQRITNSRLGRIIQIDRQLQGNFRKLYGQHIFEKMECGYFEHHFIVPLRIDGLQARPIAADISQSLFHRPYAELVKQLRPTPSHIPLQRLSRLWSVHL